MSSFNVTRPHRMVTLWFLLTCMGTVTSPLCPSNSHKRLFAWMFCFPLATWCLCICISRSTFIFEGLIYLKIYTRRVFYTFKFSRIVYTLISFSMVFCTLKSSSPSSIPGILRYLFLAAFDCAARNQTPTLSFTAWQTTDLHGNSVLVTHTDRKNFRS